MLLLNARTLGWCKCTDLNLVITFPDVIPTDYDMFVLPANPPFPFVTFWNGNSLKRERTLCLHLPLPLGLGLGASDVVR